MKPSTVSADPALQRVLASTTAAVGAVRGGAVAGQQIEALRSGLETVRRAQAQLEWLALQLVREVDLSGSHVADGALTTRSWLRQTVRMAPGEASAAVRTARGLGVAGRDVGGAGRRRHRPCPRAAHRQGRGRRARGSGRADRAARAVRRPDIRAR